MSRGLTYTKKRLIRTLKQVRHPSLGLFRERPEVLFVPLTLVCFLLSLAPFAYGLQWGQKFVHYLLDPTANQISPVTWSAAWLTFGTTLILMVRRTRLTSLRCAMVAASVPFAATGVFEIFFQALGVSLRGFHWGSYDWFALSLWAAIGITGLPFWKLTRMFWFWLAATIVGFAAWAFDGYPQIDWGASENVPMAYSFAIALKAIVFLLLATPLLSGVLGRPKMETPWAE